MVEQAISPAIPAPWTADDSGRWWARVRSAPRSLLICDYDGTLAPFRDDKMTAVPYPGIAELLAQLAATPGVTLALVSGRPVRELITLLPLAERLELFGSHGREYRSARGDYRLAEPSPAVRDALDAVAAQLRTQGWAPPATERKSASLAVHWRGLAPERAVELHATAAALFREHAEGEHLAVLPFDGGLELRSTDMTKGHAIQQLLAMGEAGQPAAYLGDDTTDEDAFLALGDRGLSLLVRDEPRPSAAAFLLRPPGELTAFLQDWLAAARQAPGAGLH